MGGDWKSTTKQYDKKKFAVAQHFLDAQSTQPLTSVKPKPDFAKSKPVLVQRTLQSTRRRRVTYITLIFFQSIKKSPFRTILIPYWTKKRCINVQFALQNQLFLGLCYQQKFPPSNWWWIIWQIQNYLFIVSIPNVETKRWNVTEQENQFD